jgi:hypothetical protein
MSNKTNNPMLRTPHYPMLWALLLVGTIMLSACGGGNSSGVSQIPLTLSGNWQFTMAEQLNPDQAQPSFTGGLQGSFLLQNNSAVSGTAAYSVASQPPVGSGGSSVVCSAGSAQISGTISGQAVTLTEVAGVQTYTLTGQLSFDGLTMAGSYTSTDGAGCGIATTQAWSATLVPPLTGLITGNFHSTGGASGLINQDFAVSGTLMQGITNGVSNATVTGILSFVPPGGDTSSYPCLASASVSGQISGNTVILQLTGSDPSDLGEIGGAAGSGVSIVTFDSTSKGYVLHSIGSPAYVVNTATCPGSGSDSGDFGNLCLALNSPTACQQPITLSPASLSFPAQKVGTSTQQIITLANSSGASRDGLTLSLVNDDSIANFQVTANTCVAAGNSLGTPFALDVGQSCTVTVTFNPKETVSATGSLTVISPDDHTAFAVPISGTGLAP